MIQSTAASVARRIPAEAAPRSPLSDYYQSLLHNLRSQQVTGSETLRALGVTSCTRGEGVSTTVLNLAHESALDAGSRVLLVDLSASQSSARRLLGQPPLPGLSDSLLGDFDQNDCVVETAEDHLFVLGAGSLREQLAAVDPARAAGVIERLKTSFSFIVFDLPPVSEPSGCCAFAGCLDGIVLVVEAERVRSQVARRAKQQLVNANGNLLGVVLNKRRQHVPGWLYRYL